MTRAGLIILALAGLATLAGCTYRIEYHDRPGFYAQMTDQPITGRMVTEDGTIIVFRERNTAGSPELLSRDEEEPFKAWDEDDMGNVTVKAILPEQLLSIMLACLYRERYDVMYEQLLAQSTINAYEKLDNGAQMFMGFMNENRRELAATVNRLVLGIPRQEAFLEHQPGGVIRARLTDRVAQDYMFTAVDMVSEGGGFKLIGVR